MDATVHHVEARVHGRYLLDAIGSPDRLVVGFHGYGETADDHLEALRAIRGDRPWTLIAVQALHPFYRTSTGEVVAGWMTKLDRELAIEDNVRYTSSVLDRARADHPGLPLAVAGFSQGVAMAYRAVAAWKGQVDRLVVHGGDVPPELRGRTWSGPRVLVIRGESDQWYSAEKLARDGEWLTEIEAEHELREVACGHEWAEPAIEAAAVFLRS